MSIRSYEARTAESVVVLQRGCVADLPPGNSSSLNERIPRRIALEGTCGAAGLLQSRSSES